LSSCGSNRAADDERTAGLDRSGATRAELSRSKGSETTTITVGNPGQHTVGSKYLSCIQRDRIEMCRPQQDNRSKKAIIAASKQKTSGKE
jgi:hypothetical protein